jgi:flavodoxin/Fe-S-cluster-containing hydrogenase component 2
MKSIIIYYSQTGNTREIAHAIHRGLGQVAEHCDIIPLKKATYEDLQNYDLIGMGSPIWFAETPNITLWLDGIPYQDGKHAFFFSTHGTGPRLYAPIMARKLTMKDFTVIGWNDWYGGNQVESAPAWFTDGHPDEIDLKEAEAFGVEMGERSQRIASGEKGLIPSLPEMPAPSFQVLDLLLRAVHKIPGFSLHGRFAYNPEKCTYPRCRVCVDNCPMGYIDFSVEPRKFGQEGDQCNTGCRFCEMICPTGAITQCGDAMNSTLQSEKKRFAEIDKMEGSNAFVAEINEAEAQGRFRRLIPKEKVGLVATGADEIKRPRLKVPKDE